MDNHLSLQPTSKDKVSSAMSSVISSIVSKKMNDYQKIRHEITRWCDARRLPLSDSQKHELAILIIQDQGSDLRAATAKKLLAEKS